jgi:hypothetical protein
MKEFQETTEKKAKDKLRDIAEFAVAVSPVDTGAYVTSWSMKPSYSSGRSRTSEGKPKNQNPEAKKQEGLSQLMSDIQSLKPLETPLVVISNSSPHAKSVEYGSQVDDNWKRDGYAVFAQIRNKFR